MYSLRIKAALSRACPRGRLRTYASHAAPRLKDPSLLKSQAYINGQWISAQSGKTFAVHDPATGESITDVTELSSLETQSAIKAAYGAFPILRSMTGRERSNLLRSWHKQIQDNADDLATLITWENGKPLADSKGEVAYANSFFEWFAEEAPRAYGQTILPSGLGRRVYTVKEPIGVCGLITPWNFPAAMITRKIAPALAAGCTVVAKSPGETPLTASTLAELADRAGIPPGVVNFVTSLENTSEIGKALCESPIIRKISFTGSTNVGKLLMKQSSSTLKKLSFELGGNAPLIVFDDADLETAVQGAIASKFRSSGQTCVCANRLYVQAGIYEDFVAAFTQAVQQFKVGNGFAQGTTHGPLIHDRAVAKASEHVSDAVRRGAQLVQGGQPLTQLGANFYAPTVLRDMTAEMQLAHEETFGPVAGVFRFESEAEVVELANAAPVGLAGYFFSRDVGRCYRVADALEVGMVGVNTGLISDAAVPFGGVKESGFGREGSALGLDEYMVWKAVTVGGIGELQRK